jgi:hypothetical protein
VVLKCILIQADCKDNCLTVVSGPIICSESVSFAESLFESCIKMIRNAFERNSTQPHCHQDHPSAGYFTVDHVQVV